MESQFSIADKLERSSSSLLRIDCHFTGKTLIEYERDISEEMNSLTRRILDFPADDPTGFSAFSGRVDMMDFIRLP